MDCLLKKGVDLLFPKACLTLKSLSLIMLVKSVLTFSSSLFTPILCSIQTFSIFVSTFSSFSSNALLFSLSLSSLSILFFIVSIYTFFNHHFDFNILIWIFRFCSFITHMSFSIHNSCIHYFPNLSLDFLFLCS